MLLWFHYLMLRNRGFVLLNISEDLSSKVFNIKEMQDTLIVLNVIRCEIWFFFHECNTNSPIIPNLV